MQNRFKRLMINKEWQRSKFYKQSGYDDDCNYRLFNTNDKNSEFI